MHQQTRQFATAFRTPDQRGRGAPQINTDKQGPYHGFHVVTKRQEEECFADASDKTRTRIKPDEQIDRNETDNPDAAQPKSFMRAGTTSRVKAEAKEHQNEKGDREALVVR